MVWEGKKGLHKHGPILRTHGLGILLNRSEVTTLNLKATKESNLKRFESLFFHLFANSLIFDDKNALVILYLQNTNMVCVM